MKETNTPSDQKAEPIIPNTAADTSMKESPKADSKAPSQTKRAAADKEAGSETKIEASEEQSSIHQPLLERYVQIIESQLEKDSLKDSYINRLSKEIPTLVCNKAFYYPIAEILKRHEEFQFDYVSELHGTDFETHMEVYVSLWSSLKKQSIVLKTEVERDQPAVRSLTPLWAGADWPECEVYDLLGIRFEGHPNLKRIMLGEDWVGHPLRKDYKPHDMEV